jgi:competence protein ComEC
LVAGAVTAFFFLYQEKKPQLEVVFMDVGQGDAILIKAPDNKQVLIDGGPDNSVLQKLGQYMPFFDKTIELLILTHPHSDHVGGLPAVLKKYQVKQILYTGVNHNSPDHLAWLDEIDEQDIPLDITTTGDRFILGEDIYLDTLFPLADLTGQSAEDLNSTSVVNRLVFKDNSFLLTGDLPAEQETEIMAANLTIEAAVLKVGHHGSKYSSSESFLQAVDPQYAIIQVGQDNSFGHPHFLTLQNLEKLDITILRNDQLGDIHCLTDGQFLTCQ